MKKAAGYSAVLSNTFEAPESPTRAGILDFTARLAPQSPDRISSIPALVESELADAQKMELALYALEKKNAQAQKAASTSAGEEGKKSETHDKEKIVQDIEEGVGQQFRSELEKWQSDAQRDEAAKAERIKEINARDDRKRQVHQEMLKTVEDFQANINLDTARIRSMVKTSKMNSALPENPEDDDEAVMRRHAEIDKHRQLFNDDMDDQRRNLLIDTDRMMLKLHERMAWKDNPEKALPTPSSSLVSSSTSSVTTSPKTSRKSSISSNASHFDPLPQPTANTTQFQRDKGKERETPRS